MIKSVKVLPKIHKISGCEYIVFDELPLDQQEAWQKLGGIYTSPIFESNKATYYYKDYGKFYDLVANDRCFLWD